MGGIIIALPKSEDAKRISEMLQRRGIDTTAICNTASNVLSLAHQLDSGVVISTRRLTDMYYTELAENLPAYFDLLLLAPRERRGELLDTIDILEMPFRASQLASAVEEIQNRQNRSLRQVRRQKGRSRQEQELIDRAKEILIERRGMTEQEAFRYIQKSSMDSGTNMVETAQMVLLLNDAG